MPNRLYLPSSIYESLPYLYMAGGAIVLVTLPNVWGISSGLVLLTTGAWVWWNRRCYRTALRLRLVATAREAAVQASRRDTGMALLVWGTEYECGHVTIDSLHRKLFELGNALLKAILDKKTKLDVELHFDELINGLTKHLSTEETLLAEANQLTTKHQESHRKLLALGRDLAERYHKNELNEDVIFKFVTRELVSEHILKEDPKFRAGME